MLSIQHWLLFHLVAFVLLSAGTVMTSVVLAAGRKTNVVAAHVAYGTVMKRAAVLNPVGGLLLVVSGIGLTKAEGLSMGAPWISAAFTLWLISFATAAAVMRPFGASVGAAVGAAVGKGEATSEALPALYAAAKPKIAARVLEITFLVTLLDMVYKPGA